MKFSKFKQLVQNYPLFRSSLFQHLTEEVPTLRRQVSEWCAKGYLIQLKRGVYTLKDEDRSVHFSRFFLSNQLYAPSYVSLESALGFYNMIPEGVFAVTAVSSKKTQTFETDLGLFSYHHIKLNYFNDYISQKDEFGQTFSIATPERALVDLLYFKTRGLKKISPAIFTEHFRLQNLSILNKEKLLQTAITLNQKNLLDLTELLIKQIG